MKKKANRLSTTAIYNSVKMNNSKKSPPMVESDNTIGGLVMQRSCKYIKTLKL